MSTSFKLAIVLAISAVALTQSSKNTGEKCAVYLKKACTQCLIPIVANKPCGATDDSVKSIDKCTVYDANGCVTCEDGYTLNNKKCDKITIADCIQQTAGNCTLCTGNKALAADAKTCVAVPTDKQETNCVAYAADNKCGRCAKNFALNETTGKCVANTAGCTMMRNPSTQQKSATTRILAEAAAATPVCVACDIKNYHSTEGGEGLNNKQICAKNTAGSSTETTTSSSAKLMGAAAIIAFGTLLI